MIEPQKHILITTGVYPPEIGGPATYTFLMEKELPRYGFFVSVLPFRTVRKLPKIIRHVAFFFKVLKMSKGANLLYAQDPVSVGIPTLLVAKLLRKPFLIRMPGDYAWEQSVQRFGVTDSIDDFQIKKYSFKVEFLRELQKFTSNHADCIITPSKYFKNLVSEWVKDKDKVTHIYNGVDFSDTDLVEHETEPRTLISAGRLLPWKGFDKLIRILVKLPDWKLYIAGDGPEEENLSRLSMGLGIEDRVIFLGSIPRRDLLKKIQTCEIFVLNTAFESFSFQVVEAMRVGTPVIITKVGSLPEIVEDNKEGILVEPNNEQMIIDTIKKIHSEKEFKNRIINNAFKKTEMFSVGLTVKKTSEVILNLIGK